MWADGLGSSSEQGLPRCQAMRLLDLAQRATQSTSPNFWIDSLCIPKSQPARNNAIIVMRSTYANASQVIVLDNGNRKQSRSSPSEVLFCVIYTSGWMQRLWTYQEALLARQLTFEFSDGLYTLQIDSLLDQRGPTLPRSVCVVWRGLVSQSLRLLGRNSEGRNIASVSRDSTWRSTSKQTDEMLAVAGILGINVERLLSAAGRMDLKAEISDIKKVELKIVVQEKRMVAAFQALERLPLDIIFLSGRKIQWALDPGTSQRKEPTRPP